MKSTNQEVSTELLTSKDLGFYKKKKKNTFAFLGLIILVAEQNINCHGYDCDKENYQIIRLLTIMYLFFQLLNNKIMG